MAGNWRPGRFAWKEDRELIAMAADGATVAEAAAKFKTTAETIERKAKALGIRIKGHRGELGLKAKGNNGTVRPPRALASQPRSRRG